VTHHRDRDAEVREATGKVPSHTSFPVPIAVRMGPQAAPEFTRSAKNRDSHVDLRCRGYRRNVRSGLGSKRFPLSACEPEASRHFGSRNRVRWGMERDSVSQCVAEIP
jgi:hypothetical protein